MSSSSLGRSRPSARATPKCWGEAIAAACSALRGEAALCNKSGSIYAVFDGAGTPTDLFWSPSSPGYTEEQANRYSYDPEKASKMLEDAGAKGAKVTIIIPAIPANRSIFEIVQNNLREVGLEPEARVLDVAEYDQRQVMADLVAQQYRRNDQAFRRGSFRVRSECVI